MMVALDGTIVAIANPAIQQDLGATFAEVQWITNGYFLALAVSLITAGKLGDRFGHRQTFLIGVVGFAVASGAIGLSSSIGLVVTFRVLQGLFGALLMPAALGLLRATFPAEKLNMAIGIWGMVIGASTMRRPILGGVLVEHVNWQSVFFINVPVGILAVALGAWILLDHRAENAPRSFDLLGIGLLSGAMFCLVWALINAPEWGWGAGKTWLFVAVSVVGFVLFALWEKRVKEPLIPLALFRSIPLSARRGPDGPDGHRVHGRPVLRDLLLAERARHGPDRRRSAPASAHRHDDRRLPARGRDDHQARPARTAGRMAWRAPPSPCTACPRWRRTRAAP